MLNVIIDVIEELFRNWDNLDGGTESLVTNVRISLEKLEINHPHSILADLGLKISNLLKRLDQGCPEEGGEGFLKHHLNEFWRRF